MPSASPLQNADRIASRVLVHVVQSGWIAQTAWQRIAESRRRVRARRSIYGGSQLNDTERRDDIRARLAHGQLQRIQASAWVELADGDRHCACCGWPITIRQIEYEPHAAPGQFAHAACFRAWYSESART